MAVRVNVHGGNGENAIKTLKRNMQRELIFRKMKEAKFYEPPSVKKVREKEESERRARKDAYRRKMQDE